jgi:hypothetical protein
VVHRIRCASSQPCERCDLGRVRDQVSCDWRICDNPRPWASSFQSSCHCGRCCNCFRLKPDRCRACQHKIEGHISAPSGMRHVGARASAGFTRPANSVLGIRLWPEHFTGQPLLPSQTFLWFDEKTGGMRLLPLCPAGGCVATLKTLTEDAARETARRGLRPPDRTACR